jgi:hypothetical protein
VDAQKSIQDTLERLLWAIDIWATIGGLAPTGIYKVTFTFDDSIVVDKEARFATDLQLVNATIISKVEFRVRNLGETEEVARQKLAEIDAQKQADAAIEFGTPGFGGA